MQPLHEVTCFLTYVKSVYMLLARVTDSYCRSFAGNLVRKNANS